MCLLAIYGKSFPVNACRWQPRYIVLYEVYKYSVHSIPHWPWHAPGTLTCAGLSRVKEERHGRRAGYSVIHFSFILMTYLSIYLFLIHMISILSPQLRRIIANVLQHKLHLNQYL